MATSRNAIKYARTISGWLHEHEQKTFFYHDLPEELKSFALFQKSRAHGTIFKVRMEHVPWQDHKAPLWKVDKRYEH
jgi:hypothetical protein